jgi:hypothetical protein
MYAVATHLEQNSNLFQTIGAVVEASSQGLRVRTNAGVLAARRALSCLVEPEPGDSVLIAGDLGRQVFVLAVLERPEASPLRIAVDQDLAIGVRNGRFSIAAAEGVDMVSAKDMTVTASDLSVRAASARLFLDQLSYLGRSVLAQAEKIKLVGGLFDAVMDRISHKVKRCYRTVEEIDHLRGGQIDYRADNNMNLRGRNALVTADALVKIDGDQIHLG